eukprot:scaffold118998_cov30-Cyclotella_meneghiniana.AAC.1
MAAAALLLLLLAAAALTVHAYIPTAYIDIRRTHSNLEGVFLFFCGALFFLFCVLREMSEGH